jgi:hypothetical protein
MHASAENDSDEGFALPGKQALHATWPSLSA